MESGEGVSSLSSLDLKVGISLMQPPQLHTRAGIIMAGLTRGIMGMCRAISQGPTTIGTIMVT